MIEMGPIGATLTPAEAAEQLWDAVVIGAGPAGALAARELARRGAATLLVDKATFPRGKVCGCCLNGAALAALDDVGLGDLPRRLGARPLTRVDLHHRRRCTTLPLPAGAAVSREALDAALVREAIASGAAFASGVAARVEPGARRAGGRRVVALHEPARPHEHARRTDANPHPAGEGGARATPCGVGSEATRGPLAEGEHEGDGEAVHVPTRVVIAADGLGGRSLRREPGMDVRVAPAALVGGGAVLPVEASNAAAGVIHMVVGRGGYVGLVRLEDGRVDVAAALQPERVRDAGGLARAVERVLTGAGVSVGCGDDAGIGDDRGCDIGGVGVCGLGGADTHGTVAADARGVGGASERRVEGRLDLAIDAAMLHAARWRGTPRLTCARAVGGERLFVVGDAAGYVEPFTGQGIAWALAGGAAVAPLALAAVRRWTADLAQEWIWRYDELLGGSRRRCARLTAALRVEPLVLAATAALRLAPWLARPAMRGLNRAVGATRC